MTLHLDDITLTYPDGDQRLTALDHVSLTAEPGTLTAIVGPSGSGKSSLLAVAATLITPDSGRVVLDGRDLAELNRAGHRRRPSGADRDHLPKLEPACLPHRHRPAAGRRPHGRPRHDCRVRAGHRAARRRRLAGQADKRPHQLSGGQRQRVTIDTHRGEAILNLLRQLTTDRSLTTIMVTHNKQHLGSADRVTEIIDGKTRQLANW